MPQLLLEDKPIQSILGIELVIDVPLLQGQKCLSYDDVKRIIKGKFSSVGEYKRYVINHGLVVKGLPKDPYTAFGKGVYKGWSDFLGTDVTGSEQRTNFLNAKPWELANEARRQIGEASRQRRAEEKAQKAMEKAYQRKLRLEERRKKASGNSIATIVSSMVLPSSVASTNIDLKVVCDFLIDNGMIDIAEMIAYHKSLTLSDARLVTKSLLDHYKQLSVK
jgi:hypothetical protein